LERIKNLGKYQKAILLFILIMIPVFAVLYSVTVSRIGFEYQNSILLPHNENGNTIYIGKIQGKQAIFTVSADNTVEFQHGEKRYGPYTAKEDATAIPQDSNMVEMMTGVELCHGEEVIFRGGVYKLDDFLWLISEDQSSATISVQMDTFSGIEWVENGDIIDPMEPSASTILDLMAGPKLTHKGSWEVWFLGVFVCFIATIMILFADELFRLNLALRIRNAEYAEPSDWEISSRYIAWTLCSICALILFIIGLQ